MLKPIVFHLHVQKSQDYTGLFSV